MEAWEAARNALENVLEAVRGESVVIVCDDQKEKVGRAFVDGAISLGLWTRFILLKTGVETRGEVPSHLLEVLTRQRPDMYINLMRDLMEETPFRIRVIQLETRGRRARLGHCPGVTVDMLTEGALALTDEEQRRMQEFAYRLMQQLDGAVRIEVNSPGGTQLSLSVEGRQFFTDTKLNWKTLKWMNLPTGEVIVAPVENSLAGRLICDLAIGGIGPIETPVEITIKNGKAAEPTSENKEVLNRVKGTLDTDRWSDIVGEFAFGINPKARFVEEFLEAEKILGTVHIAFGNNMDMPGGRNQSKNHLDFLVDKPTVKAAKKNGTMTTILEDGRFKI